MAKHRPEMLRHLVVSHMQAIPTTAAINDMTALLEKSFNKHPNEDNKFRPLLESAF
jgi:hypothetical protein